jgi:hypothetical protein
MSRAVIRGAIRGNKLSDFRSSLGSRDPEDWEEAGFDALEVYIDTSACYVYMAYPEADPLQILPVHKDVEGWWSLLEENTTITDEVEPFDVLVDDGPVDDGQFLKIVADRGQEEAVREGIAGLGEGVADELGVDGFEAYVQEHELVLRAGAADEAWLDEPLDDLDGGTLAGFLSEHTDFQPGSRGFVKLSPVHDTDAVVGVQDV